MSIPLDGVRRPELALEDHLAGALLGQALGDALGFVVEAESPEVARAYVREWLMAGRAGERSPRDHPFGQYSDDTQLARALLLAVRDAGGWEPGAFARRVAELFGERRDVGAGPGTRQAAQRLLSGVHWESAGTPAPYAGNGSAMRVPPLGVLLAGDADTLREAAAAQSRVTHRDPRCAGAAVAIAGAAALASRGAAIDPDAFLEELAAMVAPVSSEVAVVLEAVGRWVDFPPDEAARQVHASRLDRGHGDRWQGISAAVLPSIGWALYAFLRTPDDYWSTVCTAIEVGGDTDTMAAMAGGIAGARAGVAALPRVLLNQLNDRGEWTATELEALARACGRFAVR